MLPASAVTCARHQMAEKSEMEMMSTSQPAPKCPFSPSENEPERRQKYEVTSAAVHQ